jgi:arabinan endo-1,5-alpha-L-arabinosidase
VLACAGLACAPAASGEQANFPYPSPQLVAGDTQVHDPMMLIAPNAPRYRLFSTGQGVEYRASDDRTTYSSSQPAFPVAAPWWVTYINSEQKVWGPDVSYHPRSDGRNYWMYYAVSRWPTQGEQQPKAAIGLATSPNGLPGTWADQGMVIEGQDGVTPWRAIGPNLAVAPGSPEQWYLVFGSAGRIFSAKLDPLTGKRPLLNPPAPELIAHHSGTVPNSGGNEAPFMYRRTNPGSNAAYYYLFTSWGSCCSAGDDVTYDVRVGRSTSPAGGFVDRSGQPLNTPANPGNGGGTLVLEGHGARVQAAGHPGVFRDLDGTDRLTYHWYDKNDTAWPDGYLGINAINWTADGWPYLMHGYGSRLPAPHRIFSEDFLQSPNGRYKFLVGQSCNMKLLDVVADPDQQLWESNTDAADRKNCRLVMQSGGALVLYNGDIDNGRLGALWTADPTVGTGDGNELRVQDDGNFVVYDAGNKALCDRFATTQTPPCGP